ncbi:MAG: sigma-54-dependent Fis family transcriptional regulator [Planctomycetes bacterium]|nr:sigma-54-dependent Fis family transcriptional regulator [Planctomycetota bacterium]
MKTRLLFVDDDETFRGVLHRELVGFGYEVESFAHAEAALEYLRSNRVEVALLDLRLPGMDGLALLREVSGLDPELPVIILTGHGSFPDAVSAMRSGAFDFLGKPVPLDELELALERAVEHGALRRRNRLLRKLIDREVAPEIVGESAAIRELRESIKRVAPTDVRVLIQGESGTGKELVARAIHEASARREAAFVVVNCAAIPAELFESELFGHSRGAFTGAGQRRLGLIELAEGGTLFLDEVGELPLALQPALLRAVQFGEYRPLGAERAEHADVRFLTATNRDLQIAVDRGEFREDLYHRVASLTIHVPPLRERGSDVQLLAQRLLAAHNANQSTGGSRTFTEAALERLQAHDWTGNVRELENVVVRLVTLVDSDRIEAADVDRHLRPMGRREAGGLPSLDLETLERSAIVQALTRHAGNRGRAAAELGVATKTLYNKIRHHDIAASEWGG